MLATASHHQVFVMAGACDHANLLVIILAIAHPKDWLARDIILPPTTNTLKEVEGARCFSLG